MEQQKHVECFVFKQKTAYELRIGDWSSDGCSSDLPCSRWCLPCRVRYRPRGALLPHHFTFRRSEAFGGLLSVALSLNRSNDRPAGQIGSASCRERVCQYV